MGNRHHAGRELPLIFLEECRSVLRPALRFSLELSCRRTVFEEYSRLPSTSHFDWEVLVIAGKVRPAGDGGENAPTRRPKKPATFNL